MGRKRDRSEPRERLSPTATLSNMTDDLIRELNIPELPDGIPQRLEEAIQARVNALLYHLRESKKQRYVKALEMRLVRDAFRAVLTAYELGVADAEVLYATFRHLLDELGYQSADIGFVRRPRKDPEGQGTPPL